MVASGQSAGLVATGVTVAFDGAPVLSGVDCSVVPGALTGIIGPSGGGKTTLLRVLAGLQRVTSGTITYDGAPAPRPGGVALLAQSPRQACNPRWTLREIIGEPARVRRRTPAPSAASAPASPPAEAAERVGLSPSLLDRYPAQLSDGQLQRACVARVLVQRPRYLLCDEPTAMLDPIATRAIIGLIDDLVADGLAAALVTHDHRLARARCASILILAPASGGFDAPLA